MAVSPPLTQEKETKVRKPRKTGGLLILLNGIKKRGGAAAEHEEEMAVGRVGRLSEEAAVCRKRRPRRGSTRNGFSNLSKGSPIQEVLGERSGCH